LRGNLRPGCIEGEVADRWNSKEENKVARPKKPSYTALLAFAKTASRLIKDGECRTCGRDGFDDNPECPKHGPFDMRGDDAVDSLHVLISEARELSAQKQIKRRTTC
jgi:hypothetical protein